MNDYGYIGFSYSRGHFVDKAISWVINSKWSHSFITVPNIVEREMVMESGQEGVSMCPFDLHFRDNPEVIYELYRFKCDKSIKDKAISDCIDRLETEYGYLEFPFLLFRYICLLFGKDIKKMNNWSKQGTICSGLVREYMEKCELSSLFEGYGIDTVTPEDIYKIVKSNPELFELVEIKNI